MPAPTCAEHAKSISDQGQRLALTERSVVSIERTMEAVSTKMDILIGTMTKVALLEEKHGNQQQDVTRAHAKIADISEKLDRLSEDTRGFMKYTEGQNKVLWAIGSVVLGLLIKALFFASSHGMTP
jgi:uncharacterized protein YaaR (DUF327 family)